MVAGQEPAAPSAPPLCLLEVEGLPGAARLVRVLAVFGRCTVHCYQNMVDLLPELRIHRSAVIVAPAEQKPETLLTLHRWLSSSSLDARLIVAGPDGLPDQKWGRFADCTNFQPLTGRHRIEARLVEAVVTALGVKPRVSARVDAVLGGEVVPEFGAPLPFKLLNLSESGAKVRVNRPLAIGMPVRFRLLFEDRILEAEALPMRKVTLPDGNFEFGLQFEWPPDEIANVLRALKARQVGASENPLVSEPVRSTTRLHLPGALRVKARVRAVSEKRVDYLTVLDLSRGGFSGAAAPNIELPLKEGDRVEIVTLWGSRSFEALAQVIRLSHSNGLQVFAFQFEPIERSEEAALTSLLADLQERAVMAPLARKRKAREGDKA